VLSLEESGTSFEFMEFEGLTHRGWMQTSSELVRRRNHELNEFSWEGKGRRFMRSGASQGYLSVEVGSAFHGGILFRIRNALVICYSLD